MLVTETGTRPVSCKL